MSSEVLASSWKNFRGHSILNHTRVLCGTVSWVKILWFTSQPRKPRNFTPRKIPAIRYVHTCMYTVHVHTYICGNCIHVRVCELYAYMYMYSLVILHQIGGRVGLSHEGRENFIVCGQTHVHCTCVRVAVHTTKQVTWGLLFELETGDV